MPHESLTAHLASATPPPYGKSGYLSQSALPLYFGLRGFDHAASIEIIWPSGKKQTVAGSISAGKTIEVVEP